MDCEALLQKKCYWKWVWTEPGYSLNSFDSCFVEHELGVDVFGSKPSVLSISTVNIEFKFDIKTL